LVININSDAAYDNDNDDTYEVSFTCASTYLFVPPLPTLHGNRVPLHYDEYLGESKRFTFQKHVTAAINTFKRKEELLGA
jgi:hypothetical protein